MRFAVPPPHPNHYPPSAHPPTAAEQVQQAARPLRRPPAGGYFCSINWLQSAAAFYAAKWWAVQRAACLPSWPLTTLLLFDFRSVTGCGSCAASSERSGLKQTCQRRCRGLQLSRWQSAQRPPCAAPRVGRVQGVPAAADRIVVAPRMRLRRSLIAASMPTILQPGTMSRTPWTTAAAGAPASTALPGWQQTTWQKCTAGVRGCDGSSGSSGTTTRRHKHACWHLVSMCSAVLIHLQPSKHRPARIRCCRCCHQPVVGMCTSRAERHTQQGCQVARATWRKPLDRIPAEQRGCVSGLAAPKQATRRLSGTPMSCKASLGNSCTAPILLSAPQS